MAVDVGITLSRRAARRGDYSTLLVSIDPTVSPRRNTDGYALPRFQRVGSAGGWQKGCFTLPGRTNPGPLHREATNGHRGKSATERRSTLPLIVLLGVIYVGAATLGSTRRRPGGRDRVMTAP